MSDDDTVLGYERVDGTVGLRNHVVVLAAMDSANPTVRRVAAMVPTTEGVTLPYGRGQYGADGELTRTVQIGLGANPNVAACVVVSLEPVSAGEIAEGIAATGKPVAAVTIQGAGGPLRAAGEAAELAAKMVREASRLRRTRVPVHRLVLGVECGGSDTTSGIAANPALGEVADWLIDRGGTVYLSETAEILGAEHVLARRAATAEVAEEIFRIVGEVEAEANRRGVDIRGANPVPDNIEGGLTTIEEKSLGAILKAGTRPVVGVLGYGQRAKQPGLHVMDTPAPAVESLTGLTAGGCQLVGFTTGVGNSIGVKITPVVKISGHPGTVSRMADAVDADVSDITTGRRSIADVGADLRRIMLEVAEGTRTTAEVLGEQEVAISRIGTTI